MGRPKLYHSAEERLAANRAKSLQSYHKYVTPKTIDFYAELTILRRKSESNVRRRAKYKAGAKRQTLRKPVQTPSEIDHSCSRCINVSALTHDGRANNTLCSERRDLAFWMKKVEGVAYEHRAVVGDAPFNYLDNLYHDYSITQRKLGLQTAADTHDALAQALVNAQNAILNINGVDDAFRRTEEVIRPIRSINSYISDVLCDCMADPNSVELKHQNQEFEYQKWLKGQHYVDL
ncbi:hypothetical protein H0H92_007766 [Tricholoma furcatifolium]|nr:hypothetical protein H0H92_007766 [Tricholoma furcatifolium]